jgi:hypothetical protein
VVVPGRVLSNARVTVDGGRVAAVVADAAPDADIHLPSGFLVPGLQPRELLAAADIVIADFEDLEPVGWLREVAGTG